MHGYPFDEIKVANPKPNTTVFGLIIFMDYSKWYYPGYRTKCIKFSSNFLLIVSAESDSFAT